MTRYIALEKLLHLHDGYRQIFLVENKQLLLIQENGHRYLINAQCPHSQWSLQSSHILGNEITCSKHGWAFNLQSGRAANERALGCQLGIYKIAYEGNTVGVMLS